MRINADFSQRVVARARPPVGRLADAARQFGSGKTLTCGPTGGGTRASGHLIVGPEPLAWHHFLDQFDCGKPALTGWLRHYARMNQGARTTKTYVIHVDNRVIGYYSLCPDTAAWRTLVRPVLIARLSARLEDGILLNQLADPVDEDAHLCREVTALRIHHRDG